MQTKRLFIAVLFAVAAPLAAQAESPSELIFPFADAPSTRSRADVRAEVLALGHTRQRAGEVYPLDVAEGVSVRSAAEVRAEARRAPRVSGELYSADVAGH
jgi:hypothetical protein